MDGVVVRAQGGRYDVRLSDDTAVEASLRGRIKRQDRTGERVVIGDRVTVQGDADSGYTVEDVRPRSVELVRRGPGGRRAKVLAANLDHLAVVVSAVSPDASPELVDRLLAVAESSRIPSVLVINKLDLPGATEVAEQLAEMYRRIGYRVILTSAVTGLGLEPLQALLCGGSSALVGPSGVGKSSLLNAVEPGLDLRVSEVSRRIQRGRHTTVTSRLIQLDCGGLVADTPGFGDVGLWGVSPEHLDELFPDFRPYVGSCRFRGCSHLQEPDCAVREALAEGVISAGRYESYRTLRAEAS